MQDIGIVNQTRAINVLLSLIYDQHFYAVSVHTLTLASWEREVS